MKVLTIIFIIFIYSCGNRVDAYNYGEHKYIGEMAMLKFIKQENNSTFITKYFPLAENEHDTYIFPPISHHNPISYGVINALSGDHSGNVFILEKLLLINSYLQKVITMHNQYLAMNLSAAPDKFLLKVDNKYALLALKNMAHFYEYGEGWKEHFESMDLNDIELLTDRSTSSEVFKKLNKTNPLLMYATLHSSAMYLARQAGISALKNNVDDAKQKLYYAFLFNGYADHFLEDAFSSGHLLVNRTITKSLVNNKPLHDFYSRQGVWVVNRNGEKWKAYGDNMYNKNGLLNAQSNLSNLKYEDLNTEDKRVIDAVQYSISEIRDAFETTVLTKQSALPICEAKDLAQFIMNNYKAMHLIPLPFGTKLHEVLNTSPNDTMGRINAKPYLRNFIRNRSANAVVVGITNGIVGSNVNYFQGLEFRLNFGQLYTRFNTNLKSNKRGTSDMWLGYTASFTFGQLGPIEKGNQARFYKAGIRSNFDLWVNDRSFVGLFMYTEAGIMHNLGKNVPIFSPQIGIQLGSLLGINYYNIPTLWRLPLQLILPLKLKINATYANRYSPIYAKGVELDISF